MNLRQNILPCLGLSTLAAFAQAQTYNFNPNLLATLYPTLPPVESRFGSYTNGIGNDWLGGSVHAYAGMVRQNQGSYQLGNASLELRGTGKVLRFSQEVAEVVGVASNVMNNGVQTRSGSFRIEVLGVAVINSSFQNSSTFAQRNWTFNLFGSEGVSASVPVGPVSVSLRGNAGCGLGTSANWLLPAATASVGLNGAANAYAFADARVGVGIPGFGLGCGIEGRIADQRVSANVSAHATSGLSGGVSYTLTPITLRLYAWAQALYTWTTTLTSWSMAAVSRTLA